MTDFLADTYYFIALLGSDDEERRRAIAATEGEAGRLITTSWILAELANFLHRATDRGEFVGLYDALRLNPDVVILPPTQELFDRGIELYRNRPDKDWSLTDCISFVVMEDLGLSHALTADRHFEQAGFIAVLK